MRPRPLTILLLLLAGAVVNVGVAWGVTPKPRPQSTRGFLLSHDSAPSWFFVEDHTTGTGWVIASTFPFADVHWEHRRSCSTMERG